MLLETFFEKYKDFERQVAENIFKYEDSGDFYGLRLTQYEIGGKKIEYK